MQVMLKTAKANRVRAVQRLEPLTRGRRSMMRQGLEACATIGAIAKGVHDEISREGLLEHYIVQGGAVVDMYAKCGAVRRRKVS